MPENQVPYVNLVYSFVNGPTLSDCLTSTATATPTTSSDDPISFVSTWVSRMEIALGVARGLDYIHNRTGFDAVFVHNRIKSSNIILTYTHHEFVRSTKPQICNFGLAHAAGETAADDDDVGGGERQPLMEDEEGYPYMSPELHREGIATQKSDVYAFGVLLLELISGKEPLTYRYDDASKAYVRTSVVESARAIFLDEGEEERTEEEKVKCWVDGRLNRLFPVKLAIKAIRIALLCVTEDPKLRPDMGFVEGLIFECSLQSNSNRVFF